MRIHIARDSARSAAIAIRRPASGMHPERFTRQDPSLLRVGTWPQNAIPATPGARSKELPIVVTTVTGSGGRMILFALNWEMSARNVTTRYPGQPYDLTIHRRQALRLTQDTGHSTAMSVIPTTRFSAFRFPVFHAIRTITRPPRIRTTLPPVFLQSARNATGSPIQASAEPV